MAKMEKVFDYEFDGLLKLIEEGVLNTSFTSTLEDSSDFERGTARCAVRVFERYSLTGSNRLSLSITLFQNDGGPVYFSAITAGGSDSIFSYNTAGENAFLDKLLEILCGDDELYRQLKSQTGD